MLLNLSDSFYVTSTIKRPYERNDKSKTVTQKKILRKTKRRSDGKTKKARVYKGLGLRRLFF